MNNKPRIPDAQTRALSVARMREISTMFDAQIMLLDELIAKLEADNRNNPINVYRRERGKRLLEALLQESQENATE